MATKYKMKTKKSISKRIKITGTGKIMHYSKGNNHLKSPKSAAQLRRLAKPRQITGKLEKNFKKLLPYGTQ
jgi:large subunit ribosomal protein L35